MSSKVDKFFNDKLQADSLAPSAAAWDKVERHLSKKNKFVIFWRVAAAIVLLALVAILAFNWDDATKPSSKFAQQKPKADQPNQQPSPEARIETAENKPQEKKSPEKKTIRKRTTSPVAPVIEPVQEEVTVVSNTPVEEPQLITPEIVKPVESKSTVIVFSLPKVQRKSTAPVEVAMDEEQKKTMLRKVMDVAMDVKNADSPMKELREAKDDLFALDFRKDKDKKKN